MSGTTTIFETCIASFPDTTTQLTELLRCVSVAHETASVAAVADVAGGLNAFFLIILGALVFFMETGFAMLVAGSIRAKNVKNVVLWNLMDACGGGLAFWATGWAFAYGGDNDGLESYDKTFVGTKGFFLKGDNVPYQMWLFQFAFAAALPSVVAGAIAERTQMKAYLLFSFFLVGFAYPVIAHSLWSKSGFLSAFATDPLWGSGAIDLAGSGPVHMCGGVTALAAAIILGPRIGKFYDEEGNPLDEPAEFIPYSAALQYLGTFCLWFGWYGFNPGSVGTIASISQGEMSALVAVNTTLAACAGAISALFTSTLWDYYFTGVHTYDVGYFMNGSLSGLVAITAGCATVTTGGAVIIGIISGWVYMGVSKTLIRLRIDDAVDAIPVHMGGGTWGVLATGLFSTKERVLALTTRDSHYGWFYELADGSGDFTLMGCQIIAVIWIFSWSFTVMGIYFYGLHMLGWLRVDPLEEEVGMDISRHKGPAFDHTISTPETVNKLNTSRHGKSKLDLTGGSEGDIPKEESSA